jgi:hypothetical protein
MHGGFSKLVPVLLAALIAALGIHALIHHGGDGGFALSGEALDGENESDENEASDNENEPSDSENESSDDGDGIDCSIPDNKDDSGCDAGDRDNDSGDEGDDSDDDDTDDVESDDQEPRAVLPPPPEPRPPLPAEGRAAPLEHPRAADVDTGPVPRGSVATGAGGMSP